MLRRVLAAFALLVVLIIAGRSQAQPQPQHVEVSTASPRVLPPDPPTTSTTTTTSTTLPPAPPRRKPPVVVASAAGGNSGYYSSMQPCGGDLPPCWVKWRESKGNYSAYNPTGCGGRSCGGAWQFDPRTWAGFGGYAGAQDAPPDVQDTKAREVWANGAGCSHWAAC